MSSKNKKTSKYIPWWQPVIGKNEYQIVKKVFDSNFPNEGSYTDLFEKKLSSLLQTKHLLAVPSGTSAVFLAVKAFGIGPGDEVIVPDITFIATANAVEMAGAKAVLVDVDPKTLTIDPNKIEQAITKKTKAIIVVHVSGRAADIQASIKIAKKHKLAFIEDAAEAFMSKHKGKYLGTFGDVGCLSFAPTKMVTTGQGGAVIAKNEKLFKKLRLLKDHGRPQRGTGGDDVHYDLGFNFKFSNIHAAVGLGQLEYLQQRMKRMKRNYDLYREKLKNVKELRFFGFDIANGEFPLWIDATVKKRDELVAYLLKQNIHTRNLWHPIHTQAYYKRPNSEFPESSKLEKSAFWLPSAFTLTDADITSVCSNIKKFFGYSV